jgi:excisionase family DNA binding protein
VRRRIYPSPETPPEATVRPLGLTVREAAALLGVSIYVVKARIRAGQLRAVRPKGSKAYVIPRGAVEAFLAPEPEARTG